VLALANSLELNHTVRYFNSWVEELTVEEILEEEAKLERYSRKKRLSSIAESDEHVSP
jgi:hypothetical protein